MINQLNAVIITHTMLTYQDQIQQSYNPETEKVQIYVRNVKKQARLITVDSPAWPQDIIDILSSKFNISAERIILFYNGYRIDNYSLCVNLTDKSIMHLIDKQNIDRENITISFKPLFNSNTIKFSFHPDTQIGFIIKNHLEQKYNIEQNRFFIVYTGKTLNPLQTLRDSYVQNQSQLIVIKHKSIHDSFQKQAIQYNSSYHLQQSKISSVKYTAPVCYQTSIQSIKKKNKQQASLVQSNNVFLSPAPLPVITQQQKDKDYFVNESAIHITIAHAIDETTALYNQKLSRSGDKEKTVTPQINILTNTDKSSSQQLHVLNKSILQLQSHYHDISTNKIEVMPILKEVQNQKDSFIDIKSASK